MGVRVNDGRGSPVPPFDALGQFHHDGRSWLVHARTDHRGQTVILSSMRRHPSGEGWHWRHEYTLPDAPPEVTEALSRANLPGLA